VTVTADPVSITVPGASVNNGVPLVVRENGVPVNPTDVAVVAQPTNGSVAIANNLIYYSPLPSFTGSDSFTYTGTYDGQTSAPASVSVTVGKAVVPIRAMRTFRAKRLYNKTFICYARNEDGPMDVSGFTLTATVRPYQVGRPSPLATSPATQTQVGEIVWELTKQQMRFLQAFPGMDYQLGYDEDGAHGTLFYFTIDADGMIVYQALLEIVQ